MRKITGVSHDPLIYLGIISIVFFGMACFLLPRVCENDSLSDKDSNLVLNVPEACSQKINHKLVFVGPNPELKPAPDLLMVQGTALKGSSSPVNVKFSSLGSIGGEFEEADKNTRKEIIDYTVQEGDTLSSIAEKFEVSLNTLLWVNDLNKNSKIKIGQKLTILPVSGVLYEVQRGDTLSGIAKTYQGDINEIITVNDLADEKDIFFGDSLIISNGVMPPPPKVASTQSSLTPLAASYFICPIGSPCHVTQGLHRSNAIDFSNGKCGDYIYAAAGGEVSKIKYGYNNGAGNYILISHPNGVVTHYGHISASLVGVGDKVYQGQIIALMGGQPGTPGAGLSTGCHLHFGVAGAVNPFAK